MEKKNYYTPDVKFHQLRVKSMIAATTAGEDDPDDPNAHIFEAKGGSSLSFDEDE
ncbi:MAG: hypothetical protein IKZ97_05795 [Butyrivibrio sp.]|nr:hypothetical protein [Butyrivibrio sp.]